MEAVSEKHHAASSGVVFFVYGVRLPIVAQRFTLIHEDVQLIGEQRLRGPLHLVFAHGWISSRRMWDEVLALLPEQVSYTTFDFRGCGQSDRPVQGHDLLGYAKDLRAILETLAVPVVLVGHSMGARVAQYVATQAPANIQGLILVAPGVAGSTVVVPRHRELMVRAYGSRRRIHAFQRGAMVRELAPQVMERLVDDALLAQYEHWLGWYDHGRTLDFSAQLARVTVPVQLIAGEQDPLIPLGRLERELLNAYPQARLHVIGGAGHNLAVEAPNELVESFLTNLHEKFNLTQ